MARMEPKKDLIKNLPIFETASWKNRQKFIILCSPCLNSIDNFPLVLQEYFVYNKGIEPMILAQN